MSRKSQSKRVLPGFGLSLGLTILYLSLMVLIPLSAVFIKTSGLTWNGFLEIVTAPRILAAYRISFGISLAAALVNGLFGCIVAWVLTRYDFTGRQLLDALVDLPFALPTAVAGIALTAVYARNGWIGRWLEPLGIKVAFTPLGILVAMVFVSLPFVVRTMQPVIADLDREVEEAAASLGANRWQIFTRILFPILLPALLSGMTMAFARAVGEYGSIIFISGNMPMRTEIAPLLIVSKLEQYDYAGATAIAAVMLTTSFALLLLINQLQAWSTRRHAG